MEREERLDSFDVEASSECRRSWSDTLLESGRASYWRTAVASTALHGAAETKCRSSD